MRNGLGKNRRGNHNTRFMFCAFFRKWDTVEKYGGSRGATNDVTIWRMSASCWKSKATCTYAHANAHAPGYPHARTQTNI